MIELAVIHLISQPEVVLCGWVEVLSLLALSGILGGMIATYRQHICGIPWCPFLHKHPVAKTAASVCSLHHTVKHHKQLQDHHKDNYPDRLTHGELPGA